MFEKKGNKSKKSSKYSVVVKKNRSSNIEHNQHQIFHVAWF